MAKEKVTYISKFVDASHSTPVELYATSDAVHARTDHHHVTAREVQVVRVAVVSQVEIVRARRPLRGHGVNLLDDWRDAVVLTKCADT